MKTLKNFQNKIDRVFLYIFAYSFPLGLFAIGIGFLFFSEGAPKYLFIVFGSTFILMGLYFLLHVINLTLERYEEWKT